MSVCECMTESEYEELPQSGFVGPEFRDLGDDPAHTVYLNPFCSSRWVLPPPNVIPNVIRSAITEANQPVWLVGVYNAPDPNIRQAPGFSGLLTDSAKWFRI